MKAVITLVVRFHIKGSVLVTYHVHRGVRRDVSQGAEDEWHTDFANPAGLGEHTGTGIDQKWSTEAYKPHPLEVLVDGVSGEQVLGADGTPDDTSVVESLDVGACECSGCL